MNTSNRIGRCSLRALEPTWVYAQSFIGVHAQSLTFRSVRLSRTTKQSSIVHSKHHSHPALWIRVKMHTSHSPRTKGDASLVDL